jgi:cytochrome b involved in lipid metabolism/uncharacterized membrane protein
VPASTALVTADSNGPLDLINGVPVHPLVVHAAVVLVPLAAFGVLLMVVVPRFSRSLGWVVALAAAAATGACFVAKEAGEQLAKRVGQPGYDHAALGTWMPFFTTVLTVAAFLLWLVDRRKAEDRPAPRGLLGIVVAVLAALIAVSNLVWVFRVGDSGARSVWAGKVAASELPSATSSPLPSAGSKPSASPTSGSTPATSASPAVYTLAQVGAHNLQGDCWLAIRGSVYNVTEWIPQHPGGPERIIALCGTDATDAFTTQHDGQPLPNERLSQFQIGTLSS